MFTFPFTNFEEKSPLWTPVQIDTMVWCDASDISTIAGSPTVTTWADKSGNGWDLIAGGSPQTGDNTLNGLNRIDMTDSTSDFFSTGMVLDNFPGDIAIFQVCQLSNQTFASGDSVFSLNASPNIDFQFDTTSTTTDWNGRIRATGLPTATPALTNSPYQGSPRIFETVYDLNNLGVFNAYITGSKDTADSTYTIGMGATAADIIVFSNRGKARFMDGFVCEVVVIENVTVSQRQCMEGYLAWKWGLEGDLPVGHPYKNAPPTECLTNPIDLQSEFHYSPSSLVVGSRDSWDNEGTLGVSSELAVLNGSAGTPAFVDVIADATLGFNVFRLNTEFTENCFETTSAISDQASYAMYMVVKSTDGISINNDFYWATGKVYPAGPSDVIHWVYGAGGGVSKVDLVGTANQFFGSTVLADDVWHVIGFHQIDTDNVTLYTDDDDVKTHTLNITTLAKDFASFQIGGWFNPDLGAGEYNKWLHADIAEIVMITHSISSEEALSLQNFLVAKYSTPLQSPP